MTDVVINGYRIGVPLTEQHTLFHWLQLRSPEQLAAMDVGDSLNPVSSADRPNDQGLGLVELCQGLATSYAEQLHQAVHAYRAGQAQPFVRPFIELEAHARMMKELTGIDAPFHIADREYLARTLQMIGGMAVVDDQAIAQLFTAGQRTFQGGGSAGDIRMSPSDGSSRTDDSTKAKNAPARRPWQPAAPITLPHGALRVRLGKSWRDISDLHVARALVDIRRGDSAAAQRECATALRLYKKNADAYVARALLRRAMGDLNGARNDIAQALALEPQLAQAFRLQVELR